LGRDWGGGVAVSRVIALVADFGLMLNGESMPNAWLIRIFGNVTGPINLLKNSGLKRYFSA